ncbi:ADC synthase [Mycena alexandri]|uniref:aminodeoxychorismate synthase n=1 Tax=Mycena alexandri TaxID=1745969 RepID=A0AAD6T766_9AGAR|nr:ADC synthase [Mycena alexandri]
MAIETPRLLLVDSYDSFTFNLASLCKQAMPNCIIYIIKNDAFTISELLPFLPFFSAIVVGPGPGSPEKDEDIGVIKDLWNLTEHLLIPIFGVCLGLQSLGVAHGAELRRLDVLFHAVGMVEAVRYHSLHVVLAKGGDVQELAWADDGAENGRVVMAVGHTLKPFWANFWRLARRWARKTGRQTMPWNTAVETAIGRPWLSPPLPSPPLSTPSESRPAVTTQVLEMPSMDAATVSELFGVSDEESPFVMLDSAAQPGRFSIVGSLMQTSLQITYFALIFRKTLGRRDVWTWLADFMAGKRVREGHPDVLFWGGLIGVLSYELGIESLDVTLSNENHHRQHPDLNLIFVERSVVIDSLTGRVFVQSLISDDPWISDTVSILTKASSPSIKAVAPVVRLPDRCRYIARINQAKERIFAGDSYELCLTARTSISLPKVFPTDGSTSWRRYQTLRSKNPAPYSAYIRLHPTTLLSSSPERFLSTSRPPHPVFHLRPIKGTVRKAPGITRTVAEAALIGSPKEVAENLMIVDLIRHDLHAVVGEDVQVKQFCGVEEYETVWQLVSVIEGRLEPSTHAASDPDSQLGWEMLRKSLPPGSMTGAPKKRSVEILQTLEEHERGIYSGVCGYWCVGGGSDWSVTIRSCFKFEDRSNTIPCPTETWDLGAGGAITALSDAEAEWDEMIVKLKSTLPAFGVSCT